MSHTWVQDKKAINHLEDITINSFEWMYRNQPDLDYGIDGQIEICEEKNPTGRLIAIQSKGGNSYFHRNKNNILKISLSVKHLKYWNECFLPVVVIGYLPSENVSYWIYIQGYIDKNPDILDLKQKTLRIPISRSNLFNIESKQLLLSIYDQHMERLVRFVLNNRDIDLSVIQQIKSIANKSKIDANNYESIYLNRMLDNGAPLEKAVALLAKNNYEEANEILLPLIEDTEKYLGNQYAWLAGSLLLDKDYKNSLIFANKAIDINPLDCYALNIRGACYKEIGDINNALVDLNKAIKMCPAFYAPYNNKANIFYDDKQYNEAIKIYKETIIRHPTDDYAYNKIGECYQRLHDNPKALDAYKNALKYNANNAAAWKGLGDMYSDLVFPVKSTKESSKYYNLSINAYTKAIQIRPNHEAALTNRGLLNFKSGMNVAAEEDFTKVLGINTKNRHALAYLRKLNESKT